MKRKVWAIGFVAAALAAVTIVPAYYDRFESSRQSFHQYFRDLDPKGNTLNPLERFVFSLVLANSDSAPGRK